MSITKSTIVVYPYSGSTNELIIPFDYLKRDFVVVALGGDGKPQKTLKLGTDYRFATKTTIVIIRQYQPDEGYNKVIVRRVTDASKRIINYQDGSILNASELNTSQLQALHVAEEARDLANYTLFVDDNNNLDARGRKIINLGDPTNPKDAVTKTYIDKASEGVIESRDKALQYRNEAEEFKQQTQAFRDEAEGFKNIASSKATEVISKLDDANNLNTQAITNSSKAKEYALSAQNSASSASLSEKNANTSDKSASASALLAKQYAEKANPTNIVSPTFSTIEEMLNNAVSVINARAYVISYSTPISNGKPEGGGLFVYKERTLPENGVTVFNSKVSEGQWVRIFEGDLELSWGGARTDSTYQLNDPLIDKVVTLCGTLKLGLKVVGRYPASKGFSTINLKKLYGTTKSLDGFNVYNCAGRHFLEWAGTAVDIVNLGFVNKDNAQRPNDGSIGVKGSSYLGSMSNITVSRWGTGIFMHSVVDCKLDRLWVTTNKIGLYLDGNAEKSIFSTTLSVSNSDFHSNVDGIVGGSQGLSDASFIGLNFSNIILERNTNCGFVCTTSPSIGTETYSCKTMRFVNFSGYLWVEANGVNGMDLSKVENLTWNCTLRNETRDIIKQPHEATVSSYNAGNLTLGPSDSSKYSKISNNNIDFINGRYTERGAKIFSIDNTIADGNKGSSMYFYRQLDESVGVNVGLKIDLKAENEPSAVSKLTLDRKGNMTIKGSYAPFTGVHLFYSRKRIPIGYAVKALNVTRRFVGEVLVEGECTPTVIAEDIGCLGLVDTCELDVESGMWLCSIAAVGDNSTYSMLGAYVDGDFEVGDYLCTSDKEGLLKVYEGSSMKPVVLQVKGKRGKFAYGYFK